MANAETAKTESGLSKHHLTPDESRIDVIPIEMNPFGRGAAYIEKAGDQVRVVHNGKPGKLYKEIEATNLSVSPDGQHAAYSAKVGEKWLVVVDGKEYGPFDDKGPPVFSPDSRHIAYEGQIGKTWHMFVDDIKGPGIAVSYQDKAIFSGDSTRLLCIENSADHKGVLLDIRDLSNRRLSVKELRGDIAVVSADRTRIAAIEKVREEQRVIGFSFSRPDSVMEGTLYDEITKLTFSNDGNALAYVAKKGADFYLVLNGKEERLPKGEYPSSLVIRPDNKSAGIVVVGKAGAYLHKVFYDDGIGKKLYKECADLTYTGDGSRHAYLAIKNEKFTIVVNGKEGPFFDRVISPKFSPDGKFLVYRAREKGKRFVVVADASGKIIRRHPGYEMAYETAFTADGKSVAYGVQDGLQFIWKVEKLNNEKR